MLDYREAVLFSLAFTGILMLMGTLLGLYRAPFYRNARYQFLLAFKSYIYSIMVILGFFYVFRVSSVPRSFTLLFLGVAPVYVIAGRQLMLGLQRILAKRGMGDRKVILVNNGYNGVRNGETGYEWLSELGYDLRGIVTTNGADEQPAEASAHPATAHGQPGMTNGQFPKFALDKLREVVTKEGIDRIFIPSTSFVVKGLQEIVAVGREKGIKIKVLSPEASKLLKTSRVYDVAGITIYAPPRPYKDFVVGFGKRIFDIVAGSLLIILFSPIYLLTALAIYFESGWPVIYTQKRAAIKGGKVFKFYKYRSMVKGADKLRNSLEHQNESTGPLFKMRNDPRLTRVGRFLRRTSIDELPQLFNVLMGDMSLVGPRPLPVDDLDQVGYSDDLWEAISDRAKVKPGVTGLWQISGRSAITFNEMVLLDLYYVEHHSLAFDLEILFETIPAVLFGSGAY